MTDRLRELVGMLSGDFPASTIWCRRVEEILGELAGRTGVMVETAPGSGEFQPIAKSEALQSELVSSQRELAKANDELARLREMLTWKPAGFVVEEGGYYIEETETKSLRIRDLGDGMTVDGRIAGPIVPLEPEGE